MKKIKNSILFICAFIFTLIISNKVYAASTTLSASSYNVTTGTSVTITAGVQSAETWLLHLTASGGTLNGTKDTTDAVGSEVTQNVMSATFVANTPGSYTITLSGNVAGSDLVKQNVNKSITVTVSAPVQQPTPTPPPATQPTPPPAPTFQNVNQTVYATSQVNVRASYTTSSNRVGSLQKGQSVTRTGIGSNGWSRVTFNGQTAYIDSSYLTTTKPETPPSTEPSTPPSTSPDGKSNDSSLKTLSITGVELTPAFAPNVTSYVANIGKDINEVEVIAEVNNEKATREIRGNTELKDGENIVTVVVTAEDGTLTNYEIKLIKGDVTIPLDVLALVGIKENDEKVDISLGEPSIAENIVEYTINLNEYMRAIDILAKLTDELNVYDGTGKFDLKPGENKFTVTLKVTLENGETQTIEYRLTINNPERAVAKAESKINYKLIIIIGAVALVTIIGITFAVLYYRKQNAVEYGKPDYSFLREDEETKNKSEKKNDDNNDDDTPGDNGGYNYRRGGRHY